MVQHRYTSAYKGFKFTIWLRVVALEKPTRYLCGYIALTQDEVKILKDLMEDNSKVIDNSDVIHHHLGNITYAQDKTDQMLNKDDRYYTIGVDNLTPYNINYDLTLDYRSMVIRITSLIDDLILRIGSRTEEVVKSIDSDLICQLSNDYKFPLEIISNRVKEHFTSVIENEAKNDLDEAYHTFLPKE